jgi:hypothetical protein
LDTAGVFVSDAGANLLTIDSWEKLVLLSMTGNLLYLALSLHPSSPHQAIPRPPAPVARTDQTIPNPKLRIDLLAALQAQKGVTAMRNLFQFAATEVKETLKQTSPERKITPNPVMTAPDLQQPIPIPFQFYGYTSSIIKHRPKRAFFLEGDAIYIAAEGELIKNRYRVIHVGVNAAAIEDITNKIQHALPLIDSL